MLGNLIEEKDGHRTEETASEVREKSRRLVSWKPQERSFWMMEAWSVSASEMFNELLTWIWQRRGY